MDYNTNILSLKGIGDKTAKSFYKLNIHTLQDLIRYYPRDYDIFKEALLIKDMNEYEIQAVIGKVSGNTAVKKVRNLTITSVLIKDISGEIWLTFFNMPYIKSLLKTGATFVFRGKLEIRNNRKIMDQPKMYTFAEYDKLMGSLQPKYPLTSGITNNLILKAMKQALSYLDLKQDYLPTNLVENYQLVSYQEAIEGVHFPTDFQQLKKARERIVFEEFFNFLFNVRMAKDASDILKNDKSIELVADTQELLELLPYSLTKPQGKVWQEIQQDMTSEYVMNRLVQGDVGSGKTIIAFLALLMCARNGYQGALMAPTEVLAKQHFIAIEELIENYHIAIKPILLTGSMTAKEKREAYELIETGQVNLIIGTHALIQEKVAYANLALVVTDEQHRFGVRQREALAGKGENVHVLVMSATPIPRTLAIILYGDLHISIIDELPANRLPIKNCVVNTSYRPKAYEFIIKEVQENRQVYIICPMVEEGEIEGLENVTDYTEKLKGLLPSFVRVEFLHGKMKSRDKNSIMEAFSNRKIDVLVSTTVIEVGINVPNATIMMIENAERFGLAQLHQLRGRVGRGIDQSYCIFITGSNSKETKKRLEILNHSNDGFKIAEEDLKLRGPGDLFGIRQSGELAFHMADIYQDSTILKMASEAVFQVLEKQVDLRKYFEKQGIKVDFRSI